MTPVKRHYHIFAACSGWGAQVRDCEMGPEELVKGLELSNIDILYPDTKAKHHPISVSQTLPLIQNFNLKLFHKVRKAVTNKEFPIVLGGDHSIAVGTWNAFDVPFGLLWIDAHMDSHTPKTSPSGAYHGMPLAALLGYGALEMSQLVKSQAVVKPQSVALIGVRSFEEGEGALLKKLGVRIYFMDEVRKRGLKIVLSEAIQHVTREVSHYGVSLDLDVFSPEEAPGVGSPEPLGLFPSEFIPLISLFSQDERLIGFEMVEFNPHRDKKQKTYKLALNILKKVMDS